MMSRIVETGDRMYVCILCIIHVSYAYICVHGVGTAREAWEYTGKCTGTHYSSGAVPAVDISSFIEKVYIYTCTGVVPIFIGTYCAITCTREA